MQIEVNSIMDGEITTIKDFGAFVKLSTGDMGLVHISEIADTYVKDVKEFVSVGQAVKVKVIKVENKKIALSMKNVEGNNLVKREENKPRRERVQRVHFERKEPENKVLTFEDMMSRFKKTSDEKMYEYKRAAEVKHGSGRRGGSK
eukprot:TRINITY_DN390_c0_g1_i8.p1 TRINITY_DN390_c0_g1~~TRINITY_DN390_c0_g1_i8.p1  ORF type:complete len:146 (-),score=8.83 TRINITY_DN390_c0_g1_i8:71-508(-)